jgi:hypothetical protein
MALEASITPEKSTGKSDYSIASTLPEVIGA